MQMGTCIAIHSHIAIPTTKILLKYLLPILFIINLAMHINRLPHPGLIINLENPRIG